MSDEPVGRAGFHVVHEKAASKRGAILNEAMRELVPGAVEAWAKKNPNIVVADEQFDEAYVNDAAGGFTTCADIQQVLDYGADRMAPDRLSRQVTEDKPITKGPRKGQLGGGTLTTSLFVLHLPKSMCVEVPDYYPRFRQDGKPMLDPATGEQMRRSRWVARDRDQARRYFEDAIAYLCEEVIPGGQEAILGYDIQHSESTPHVQIVADTLAPDPKKEGRLRWDAARAYYAHREVMVPVLDKQGEPVMRTDKQGNVILDEDGNPEPKRRMLQGSEKLSAYHEGLKAYLVELGYDISPDFDEERHLIGQGKDDYGEAQDARAQAEAALSQVVAEREAIEAEWAPDGPKYRAAREAARAEGLAAARGAVEEARRQAEAVKKQAAADQQRSEEAAELAAADQQRAQEAARLAAGDRERARLYRAVWAQKAAEVAALVEQAQALVGDGVAAPDAFDAGVAAAVDALRGTTSGGFLKPFDVELAKEQAAAKRPRPVDRQAVATVTQRVTALAEELEQQRGRTTQLGEE